MTVRGNPYLPARYGMLQALLDLFPPVDILGIDTAILECLHGTVDLVSPKPVYLLVALPNLI